MTVTQTDGATAAGVESVEFPYFLSPDIGRNGAEKTAKTAG